MSQAVVRRTESHFRGARRHSLLRRAWLPPAAPERVLLVVHGYAEHSGRYEGLGSWFAARGCAVHAFDQQGHGRSEGVRGHVRRFRDFLDDLALLQAQVAAEHPGAPFFLVGHSMGGLIVAAYACERRPAVAGAVLSGPALALGDVPRGRILAARLLRWLVPRLSLPAGLDPQGLSRDPEVVRAYLEDPLVYDRLSVSLAAELFGAAERTAGCAGEVRIPVLLLHGGADRLCDPAGSRAFHAGLKSEGSELHVYPGLRHEIFNEPEREAVFEDLLAWLRDRRTA